MNEYVKDDAIYASDLSECSTSLAHSSYPPGYCLALKEEKKKKNIFIVNDKIRMCPMPTGQEILEISHWNLKLSFHQSPDTLN